MLLRGFDLIWSGELSLWNPLLVVELTSVIVTRILIPIKFYSYLNIAVAYSLIFLKV